MNTKLTVWGAVILGAAFFGLAALYSTTPAGNLPLFIPGYEAGITAVHFKHGLASLLLGFALFIFAWFKSGPKSA